VIGGDRYPTVDVLRVFINDMLRMTKRGLRRDGLLQIFADRLASPFCELGIRFSA
jgi:hypothetical protein